MHRKTISILSDQPILIEGLVNVISTNDDLRLLARGRKPADIYHILENNPHVVLMDIDMSGDILSAIRDCHLLSPTTRMIAFSASASIESAAKVMETGASGYVLKTGTPEELLQALKAVLEGGTYISPAFSSELIARIRRSPNQQPGGPKIALSIREDQIVRMLLIGRTNKQIAAALNITERTVKHYMTVLMQKLQARNRTEVVIAARNIEAASTGYGLTARRPILPN